MVLNVLNAFMPKQLYGKTMQFYESEKYNQMLPEGDVTKLRLPKLPILC